MHNAAPFRLDGHDYRTRPMAPKDGRHVALVLRSAAPHLPVMVPVDSDVATFAVYLQALAAALRDVPGGGKEWIGSMCLGVVERRSGLRWRPVWDGTRCKLLFGDVSRETFSMLILRVLSEAATAYLNEAEVAA